jgi:NADH dehydrogenase
MSSTSSTQSSKVCIVGGGFGGLYTALKLSKESINSNTEIYLFDNKDKFVFLPLLYELAVGTASVVEVAPRYSDLLKGTSIKFIQGKVKEIKDTKLSVVTAGNDDASPTEFNFDKLVLATGSQPRADVVSGALTNALPFSRVEDAVYMLLY